MEAPRWARWLVGELVREVVASVVLSLPFNVLLGLAPMLALSLLQHPVIGFNVGVVTFVGWSVARYQIIKTRVLMPRQRFTVAPRFENNTVWLDVTAHGRRLDLETRVIQQQGIINAPSTPWYMSWRRIRDGEQSIDLRPGNTEAAFLYSVRMASVPRRRNPDRAWERDSVPTLTFYGPTWMHNTSRLDVDCQELRFVVRFLDGKRYRDWDLRVWWCGAAIEPLPPTRP